MVHGLDAAPWSRPMEVLVELGVVWRSSSSGMAVPSGPAIEAVSRVPFGTGPGQVRSTCPLPASSVVNVCSLSWPSGPATVTVYSVLGSRCS